MRRSANHPLIQYLVTRIRCAVCKTSYRPRDVHILAHRGERWLMAVECHECRTQGLVFAVVQEGEAQPVLTELTPEEQARFQEMPPLDADDILDAHRFLRDFNGDFIRLFRGQTSTGNEKL
ncbi:MAG TPA: hypothetical protein EYP55_10490 [Anaerolineae bacterium]|nr:hypothetical protein [Anaerolineae bacterium]